MSATVYLIRHATPDWSRTDIRYDVAPGPPLTTQGEAEATQLGHFLHTVKIARLYASPLERTLRTAQIASSILGQEIEIKPELAEWERGELEATVHARIRALVDDAFTESEQLGPIGLVTHGSPIRIILADLGLASDEISHYRRTFDRDNPVPPAGVWRIVRTATGSFEQPQLVYSPQPYTPFIPATVHL